MSPRTFHISIHSLVKRETVLLFNDFVNAAYFNPLPRKEGDMSAWRFDAFSEYFNPLPRKEGDHAVMQIRKNGSISIHSLVKRETYFFTSTSVSRTDFNPLPRKEGDLRF